MLFKFYATKEPVSIFLLTKQDLDKDAKNMIVDRNHIILWSTKHVSITYD